MESWKIRLSLTDISFNIRVRKLAAKRRPSSLTSRSSALTLRMLHSQWPRKQIAELKLRSLVLKDASLSHLKSELSWKLWNLTMLFSCWSSVSSLLSSAQDSSSKCLEPWSAYLQESFCSSRLIISLSQLRISILSNKLHSSWHLWSSVYMSAKDFMYSRKSGQSHWFAL